MSFAHFLLYLTYVSVEANIVEQDQTAPMHKRLLLLPMLRIQVGLEVTFSFILCVCKQSRFWQECKFTQAGPKSSLLGIEISTNI